MAIKRGDVISHSQASEWGIGKVIDVNPFRVTVHFNDGTTRKIVNSHWDSLQPALATLYIPVPDVPQKVVTKSAPRSKKK